MNARIITRVLGVILPATLVLTSPVFANDSHYRGGRVDHEHGNGWRVGPNHSYGGYGNPGYVRPPSYGGYGNGGYGNPGYVGPPSYGGYGNPGYVGPPSYGNDYAYGSGHPAGTRGYRGKDARHHRRGHQHDHRR